MQEPYSIIAHNCESRGTIQPGWSIHVQTTVTRQAVTLYAMVTFDHRLIPLGIMYINMHIKNANICIFEFPNSRFTKAW